MNTDSQTAYLARELDAKIVASKLQGESTEGFALEIEEGDAITFWSDGLPICGLHFLGLSAPIWIVPRGGGAFPEAVRGDVQSFLEQEIAPEFRRQGWQVTELAGLADGWFRLTIERSFENVHQLLVALQFLSENFSVALDPTEVAMWAIARPPAHLSGETRAAQS